MAFTVPQSVIDATNADVAEQQKLKQETILNGMVGIYTEATGMVTIEDVAQHCIIETAKLYETNFPLLISPAGEHRIDSTDHFIGATSAFADYINSDRDPAESGL